MNQISLIVCTNEVFSIGKDNRLLYHIKDDLQRFRKLTLGNYCIMGKKTFLSLPKPFDDRVNVVLTSNPNFKGDVDYKYPNYNIMIESNLEKILNQYKNTGEQDRELFLCGGCRVYAEGMKYVDNIYLTMVHDDKEGDVYFPSLELKSFTIINTEKHYDEKSGLYYSFIDYKKKPSLD